MRSHLARPMKWVLLLIASVALAFSAGCGSDSSSGPGGGDTPQEVGGHAAKGAIDGATINLYSVSAAGDLGTLVAGPFTTDATGAWSGEIPANEDGPLLIVAEGGSYTDEATQATVQANSEMYGILQVDVGTGNATPITHAIAVNAAARIDGGASLEVGIDAAISSMTTALGYDPTSVDFSSGLRPDGLGTRAQNTDYTVLLAGISELLSNPPSGFEGADVWEMVIAIADDLSDGILQGLDAFGVIIEVDPGDGSSMPWPVLDADDLSVLIDAANDYASDMQLPPIDNPDLGDFGDVGGGIGEGNPTGSVTITGDVNMTFVPESGYAETGVLVWWTEGEASSISVNSIGGVVSSVGFVTIGAGFQVLLPQSGITVEGTTATFNGLVLTNLLNPQSTVTLNGQMGFE